MKLNDIDLYDPAEIRSVIKMLVDHYNKTWGDVKICLSEES